MAYKTVVFGLLIVLFVNYSYCYDFTDCPLPALATKIVYDQEVATSVVGSSIHVRVPDSLFLKSEITCIVIGDNSNSDSTPQIEDGGVGKYFAVINIAPVTTEQLSFRIQVYTNEPSLHQNV